MSAASEMRILGRSHDAAVEVLRAWADTWIREMMRDWITDCYVRGYLPLPPLDMHGDPAWCRTEPWYVGDLR